MIPATFKKISFKAMGSPCEVQAHLDGGVDSGIFFKAMQIEIERLEQKYSRFRKDSFLSAINNAAAKGLSTALDEETISILEHASACFQESDKLFDITAGALNKIWDFKKNQVPTDNEIAKALSITGFEKLSWDNSSLRMPVGMELDLGGVVKEYAADTLAAKAKQMGVNHGLINLGGDIAVIGCKPDDTPWPVGIKNPKKLDSTIATIEIFSGGVASSGDYERYFFYQGKRYSHIINPKIGRPNSGLRAVSVAANLCTVAGSIATIAMLKEERKAMEWLNDTGVSYIAMDSEGELLQSKRPIRELS